MKQILIILCILVSFNLHAQDTTFRQKGKDLYMTTRRGTALVRNQDIYERHYNYNLESDRRERKHIIIVDVILLAAFFTTRALINKN